MSRPIDRRGFLQGTLAGAAALAAAGTLAAADTPRLRKAVKYGMVQTDGSVESKFALLKRLGFDGVELDSPSDVNRDEAVRARDKTGLVIHGVVDSIHWQTRLSDPSPAVRAKGLEGLQTALKDSKFYGGETVLLVPGRVANPATENFDQVWERSAEQIRKAIPLAEKLGIKIGIEVVWNDFITTPEQFVKYVDQFQTPYVGAYMDCGNVVRFGPKPGDWIRQLGKRMLKFDVKGFNLDRYKKKQNAWVAIGEGSEDWPDVRKALQEIHFRGWATAEVGGGGEKELRDIAERMNRVLGL